MADTAPFTQKDFVASFVLASADEWAATPSYLLPQYALGIETDTGKAKLGDGVTEAGDLSYWNPSGGSGTGDVQGPGSSTDNALARFNLTTGKIIQNGTITEDDSGNLASVGTINGMALPAATGTLGYLNVPQNIQAADYTLVAADAGKEIFHASGAGAGDNYTIPANGTVAFPIGTVVIFTNLDSNTLEIDIASDTMIYVDQGAVTAITIPQNNTAVARKVTTTSWLITGSAGVTAT